MYDPRTPYTHQNPSYSNRGTMNFVGKNGKTSQKTEFTHNNLYSEVQFRPDHHQGAMISDQDSGVASPPLWKNNIQSPLRSPSRPLLGHRGNYQPFSPESRAEAIARGQSELMEMVRHMPELSYELSMKDIVEHRYRAENQAPKTEDESQQRALVKVVKKEESKGFDRNKSFENKGLFLNMVFPFSIRSRKKKISAFGNNSGNVSPKPEVLLKSGGGEKDWWKKKFTGSSDSDSSKISTSTGSTASSATTASSAGGVVVSDPRGRKKSGLIKGCCHFFHTRRSKSAD